MINSTFLSVVILILLLGLSFLFSIAQIALSSVGRQKLRERAEKDGNRRAAHVLDLAEDSTRGLSTFQLANLITRFLIAALLSSLILPPVANIWNTPAEAQSMLSVYYLILLLIIPAASIIMFILTSLIPQMLGQHDPEGWSMQLASFSRITIFLFDPLIRFMTIFRKMLAGKNGVHDAAFITEERIKTIIDAGEEEGSIDVEEKEMIYSIFELDETMAREVMVPRIDVVALEINTPLDAAREVIIKAGHSRIPVYTESLDHVDGLLYAKDLLEVWHEGQKTVDLKKLLRPPKFVPESKRVSELLRELQSDAVHMAIIIDEYGGTAGLVTIEDIVEEIVGEIIDEYDFGEEAAYQKIDENKYIVDARIDLDDLNRLIDVELPDELSDTLGGFIYEQLGKVPNIGEKIRTEEVELEVLSVENQRIGKVHVLVIPPEDRQTEGKGNGATH